MVQISNEVEQQRMANFLYGIDPGFEKEFWLGLTDVETEGTFLWEDGSNLAYENWNATQPNNYGGQDCGHVMITRLRTWNDDSCTRFLFALCSANPGKKFIDTAFSP